MATRKNRRTKIEKIRRGKRVQLQSRTGRYYSCGLRERGVCNNRKGGGPTSRIRHESEAVNRCWDKQREGQQTGGSGVERNCVAGGSIIWGVSTNRAGKETLGKQTKLKRNGVREFGRVKKSRVGIRGMEFYYTGGGLKGLRRSQTGFSETRKGGEKRKNSWAAERPSGIWGG